MKISEILDALRDRDPEQNVYVLYGAGQAYPIAELRVTDVPFGENTAQIVLAVTSAPPPAVESLQKEIQTLREITESLRVSLEKVDETSYLQDERDRLQFIVSQITSVLPGNPG